VKPRHVFLVVVGLGMLPILAPFVVAWMLTGVVDGAVLAGRRVRQGVRPLRRPRPLVHRRPAIA